MHGKLHLAIRTRVFDELGYLLLLLTLLPFSACLLSGLEQREPL